jgi:hypothetical protein
MKKILITSCFLLLASTVSAWTEPSQSAPGGNVAPPQRSSGLTNFYIPYFRSATGFLEKSSLTSDGDSATANGNFFITGFLKISGGSPGAGKVLTSDANGQASWVTPAAGTVTGVTASSPLASSGGAAPNLTIGNLPISIFNGGTDASATTFWRGDGTWATPAGGGGTVSWTNITGKPAGFADDTDDVGTSGGGTIGGSGTNNRLPRYTPNGTTLGNSTLTSDGESTEAIGSFNAGSLCVDWICWTTWPAGLTDGDDVGITAETDPGVLTSVKDGVSWAEITGKPAGFADDTDDVGTGGIGEESDPTVIASVKDGVSWSELGGIPSGFSDNVDNIGSSRITENADGSLRVDGGNGYIDIGPKNTSWNHIYTDRPATIFNTAIWTTTGGFSAYSTENLSLQTNGTARLTILSSNGNVGIGTASPAEKLHVTARSLFGTTMVGEVQSGWSVIEDRGSAGLALTPTGSLSLGVNIAESGNVGVGTASPSYKLHVVGDVRSDNVYTDTINSITAGDPLEINYRNTSPTKICATVNCGTVSAYFDTDGNVGIGTASPTAKLDVVGNTNISGFVSIGGSNISGNNFTVNGRATVVDNYSNGSAIGGTGISSAIMYVTNLNSAGDGFMGSGRVGVQGYTNISGGYGILCAGTSGYKCGSFGASWTTTSDGRLKENISTIANSLEKVLKLRGVNYTWKDGRIKGNQVGFIAQEVVGIVPEAVSQDIDGTYTMSYERIVPVLVEAIKELKSENDNLRARIEKLEARIGN